MESNKITGMWIWDTESNLLWHIWIPYYILFFFRCHKFRSLCQQLSWNIIQKSLEERIFPSRIVFPACFWFELEYFWDSVLFLFSFLSWRFDCYRCCSFHYTQARLALQHVTELFAFLLLCLMIMPVKLLPTSKAPGTTGKLSFCEVTIYKRKPV